MLDTFVVDSMLKIVIAFLLGGVLGIEREMHKHPAGLRTHILVAIGSAGFTLVGFSIYENLVGTTVIDPGRVIQGVITGIGFLGGGAILKEKGNVKGLTTAASIWIAASVGVLVSSDLVYVALMVTILSLLILSIMHRIEVNMETRMKAYKLIVKGSNDDVMRKTVPRLIRSAGAGVKQRGFHKSGKSIEMEYKVVLPYRMNRHKIITRLIDIDGVSEAYWS